MIIFTSGITGTVSGSSIQCVESCQSVTDQRKLGSQLILRNTKYSSHCCSGYWMQYYILFPHGKIHSYSRVYHHKPWLWNDPNWSLKQVYFWFLKKNCCKEVGKSPNPFPRSISVRRINHKVYGQNTNYIRRPSVY